MSDLPGPVQVRFTENDLGKTYCEIGGCGDPWQDLFVLMEGIGLLRRILESKGITEHNGMGLREYIHQGIDKAYDSEKYLATLKSRRGGAGVNGANRSET